MKCPACKDVSLAISDRQGIEMDYCPECRGVWLDRGELDKIIDRSSTHLEHQRHIPKGSDDHHGKGKKRKSLLGELLDF